MVDYTKQTGTQLDGMLQVDPQGIGIEWSHVVAHLQADWNAGIVDKSKWPTLASKVSAVAAELYMGLTGYSSATNGDGSGIVACVNLVSAAHTSSGAQQVIGGLAVEGITAGGAQLSEIAQNAAKKVVGSALSDAASIVSDVGGALTATGVGAAVGIAVSLAAGVFGKLFGSPPPPPYAVGNCGLNDKPKIVSKYAWTYGQVVDGGPGNPNWRRFPDRARRGDAGWFGVPKPPSGVNMFGSGQPMIPVASSWWWDGSRVRPHNDEWYACYSPGDWVARPIDHAMYDNGHDGNYGSDGTDGGQQNSVFRQLEQELLARGIVGIPAADMANFRRFQEAFVKAWKQNREFGLNGCKMQPDWKVLDKVITIWNQANGPQQTLRIPSPGSEPSMVSWNPKDRPPSTMNSYIQYLIYRYNNSMQSIQGADGAIVLNMGKINDITVGGLLPAGSLHLLTLRIAQKPKVVLPHLMRLGVSPAGLAQLRAIQVTQNIKPKRVFFFGATLAGAGVGAVAGGPIGAAIGSGAGAAVDLLRARHVEKGKWL